MNKFVKKACVALAVGCLFIAPLQAKASQGKQDIAEIREEVSIMLNILQATLKQRNDASNIQFRADAATYLAGQGVVFNIDTGRHRGHFFGLDLGGILSQIPNTPAVPKVFHDSENHIEIDINEGEIERMVKSYMGRDDDYVEDSQDRIREIAEQERELAWQKREVERARRDLDFQKRSTDNESRKEITEELAKLDKKVEKLAKKTEELKEYKLEMTSEYKKELAKRQAAKNKIYSQSLALFEEKVGKVLCRYGAGFKSLPENENISFVLSDFMQADDDSTFQTHDKVYVFNQQDVLECVTGKLDQNELLSKTNTYLF
ncbi:hypothetical protein L0668_09150 [Paraglaciecola aquimarina]|uniref:Uncharacterized protein n=1 Tax=Paraglaciecola algarum TaxID=3050085 RepID=A0ABS9D7A4_9ALTE|nr:hypothetical protein [Paraglaciecola sp. G1-23]MCF2948270.1 hypothetical protein [Paraglaciecola sp. G1-23]